MAQGLFLAPGGSQSLGSCMGDDPMDDDFIDVCASVQTTTDKSLAYQRESWLLTSALAAILLMCPAVDGLLA